MRILPIYIAIRCCGTLQALADIAILNNISITEKPIPGQLIEIPNKDYGSQEVVNFFTLNKIDPATALTDDNTAIIDGNSGIGFWEIGNNFIIQ